MKKLKYLIFLIFITASVQAQIVTQAWATLASKANPLGIAIDALGNVYTANGNNTISKITPDGVVTQAWATLATGANPKGMAIDALGNVYTANGNSTISKITSSGVVSRAWATLATDAYPHSIAIDALGNVYIANYNNTVSKITSSGVVSQVWATFPSNATVSGIAIDALGNVYTANGDSTISKITSSGVVSQAWATLATDANPNSIAIDALGNVYTANYNNTVSKITSSGVVSQVWATLPSNATVSGIVIDVYGNVYIANGMANSVSMITTSGVTTQLWAILDVGAGGPFGIALDASGNVYTFNFITNTVSKIIPIITSTSASNVSSLKSCFGTKSTNDYNSIIGNSLVTPVLINASNNLEISADTSKGYSSSINLVPVGDSIPNTTIYYRLKSSDSSGTYIDSISINTTGYSKIYTIKDTVFSVPATPIISNNRPLIFNTGDSTILSSKDTIINNIAYNVLWTNGSTSQNIAVKTSDIYSVTLSNAFGCSATSISDTVQVITPVITISSSSNYLKSCIGNTSGNQQFQLSGNGLLNPVSISSSKEIEICLKSDSSFNSSVFLNPVADTLSNTNIYYRIKSSDSVGIYRDSITISFLGSIIKMIYLTDTVNSIPVNPLVNNLHYWIGQNTDTLKASVSSNCELLWYLQKNGTSILNAPIPSSSSAGIFNYYVSQQNLSTGCASQQSTITVSVDSFPQPRFTSILPGNKRDTLNWQTDSTQNINYTRIYRDTINPPLILLDSVTPNTHQYIDVSNLKLKHKYYYRLLPINFNNITGFYSKVDSTSPFNLPPIPSSLTSRTIENAGENNFVKLMKSAAGSYDPDGKIINYSWYINDSLVDNTDSILIYNYPQGQSVVTLKVMDNDSAVSTATCTINVSAFVKRYSGGILAGITALNSGTLYVADSTYDPVNGASIKKVDSLGNTIFPLIVSSKIFTTPSVSSDSSVFITSGSSLNGFTYSGAPLWSTIALGGLSYVTPTIDSLLHRIYLGVSNANFFAIDYKSGKVIWNVNCDASINSSAVITGDRKLVFATQKGTVYGFNLAIDTTSTVVPQWKSGIAGQISTSPAVDSKNDLYFGTVAGNLVKLSLDSNGVVTTIWTASLGSSIQSSPVIDATGYVYVGNLNGQFYKIDPNTGSVIWTYQSKGSILATPSISDYGYIHIADNTGFVSCLSQSGSLIWNYQDSTAVTANLLSINGMTYIGTIGGKLIGFYDNPNTSSVNTSISYQFKNQLKNKGGGFAGLNRFSSKELLNSLFFAPPPSFVPLVSPIWGTYQGNYKRTGSKSFNCGGLAIPSINWNGSQFSTNLTNVSYQWFLNSSPVNGANGETLKPASTGNYQVEVTYGNGCQTISNSYTLVVTAVNNPSSTSTEHIAKLYPNPARSEVIVQFEQLPATEITIQLVTANGQILKQITSTNQSTIIPLMDAGSGTYYLRILGKDYNQTQQLLIIR